MTRGQARHTGTATARGGYANTGVHLGDVNLLTGTPVRTRYRQQIHRIAPALLLERAAELAELAAFCTATSTAGTYSWWQAKAWSGKSALISWFVLHPPTGVRIVSFFITARLSGQNNRAAFIDNLMEQLLALLGETLPPFLTESTREAHLLGLLAEAAEACRDRGEQFVLVVDGLDEDHGVHIGTDWHSIAALLPATLPAGMRVIVSGRPDPALPEDTQLDHPLRNPSIVRVLSPSPRAEALRVEMHRDLSTLLHGSPAEQNLLGLVAAAGGGLSTKDLAELTGWPEWDIGEHLRSVVGRSFTRRGGHYGPDSAPQVYLLGHEELQLAAVERLGPARMTGYRERLHTWAQHYRCQGWPQGTPEYLLRGYYDLLVAVGDRARMVECATDRARQKRMLDVSGGDSATLAQIVTALDVCAGEDPPDLEAMVRLAMHRDRLRDRNSNTPTHLPKVWVLLGQVNRAETIARSIADLDRKVSALRSVAEAVAETGDQERAAALLREAETTARSITNPIGQAWMLQSVAVALAKAGDPTRAEAIARSITDPHRRVSALTRVAEAVTEKGAQGGAATLLRQAETIARSLTDPKRQASTLAEVAAALAKAGDPTRAEAIARSITDPHWQVSALTWVVEAVTEKGAQERATALLRQAETIARSLTDPNEASTLAEVAVAVAKTGDQKYAAALLREVEAITRSVVDPDGQAWALRWLAQAVAKTGDHAWAETIARSTTNHSSQQAEALMWVAAAVAKAGDPTRAETIARSITNHSSQQAEALESVAAAVAKAGDPTRAETIARSITDLHWQVSALTWVAEAVTEKGEQEHAAALLREAETTARSIINPEQQASTLAEVAAAVAKAGEQEHAAALLRDAETTARSITDPEQQASTLAEVAAAVAKAGEQEHAAALLREVEAITRSVVDPDRQAWALRWLAAAVAETGDHAWAETIARSTTDPYAQASALASVAAALTETGDQERAAALLCDAETIARCITDPYRQALTLASVAAAVAKAGNPTRAETIARCITDPDRQALTLASVAAAVAKAGNPTRAETIARCITDPYRHAAALASVATAITETGDQERAAALLREAETIARCITDPWRQALTLASVAAAITETGDHGWAATIARSIVDSDLQASALASVAKHAGPRHLVHIVAQLLRLTRWHESVHEIVKTSPELARVLVCEMPKIGKQ
jgi:tetratricopeptide (TPR) repeat protein